jgi:hypothetical protein
MSESRDDDVGESEEPDGEYSDETGDDIIDEIEDLSEEEGMNNSNPPQLTRWIWQVVSTRRQCCIAYLLNTCRNH